MKVQVALGLKDCNNAEILTLADRCTAAITSNPYFTDANIVEQVTKTKKATTDLRDAITGATSDTKTDNVKMAREVLDRCLTKLANMVVDIANDPSVADANRELIVHSASFTLKEVVHSHKRVFTARNTDVSGTVELVAPGGAKAHEWQYTTDVVNFTNRMSAETTTTANTIISGLTRRTDYAFFHHPVISGEKTTWEGPVTLFVL